jgi:NAD(P)-dependent dehydrogenase (short-subunit alcohol dehydrogenase family)
MRLKNKLAVVTAGASGMGRAGCLRFAEEGAKVAVIDLNEKGAADVAGAINSAGALESRGNSRHRRS